jgi:hypothetical protein
MLRVPTCTFHTLYAISITGIFLWSDKVLYAHFIFCSEQINRSIHCPCFCRRSVGSCRTVALWFCVLVSDHNATDPVMQKRCNLWRRFFSYFSTFKFYFNQIYLFPNSRHILPPACTFYPPLFVSTNQYTS